MNWPKRTVIYVHFSWVLGLTKILPHCSFFSLWKYPVLSKIKKISLYAIEFPTFSQKVNVVEFSKTWFYIAQVPINIVDYCSFLASTFCKQISLLEATVYKDHFSTYLVFLWNQWPKHIMRISTLIFVVVVHIHVIYGVIKSSKFVSYKFIWLFFHSSV